MFIKMFMKKYIAISSHFLPCRYFLSGYFKCTETKASYVTLKRFKTQQTLKCLKSRVDQLSVRIVKSFPTVQQKNFSEFLGK